MEMCLRVLEESNKSRFNSYSRQELCIDHIPYYLSGLSRALFSDNLSRNSCIQAAAPSPLVCYRFYDVRMFFQAFDAIKKMRRRNIC